MTWDGDENDKRGCLYYELVAIGYSGQVLEIGENVETLAGGYEPVDCQFGPAGAAGDSGSSGDIWFIFW